MNLRASLLQQLENPHLTADQQAELRCQIAKELEEVGDYEGAREALGELWRGTGERPKIRGLLMNVAAEVILRAGTLTGWIGSCEQIEDAQEKAKNLISESIRLFESFSYTKKILEAQTELAYCYWRQGSYDEGRIILKGVLGQLTTDNELRVKAILRSAIVERGAHRHNDALRILSENERLFQKINSHSLKGGYHNELAIVLRNLAAFEMREDYLDRAFMEYTAASYHFEQAGHIPYCALVENNLGFLFFKASKFNEAHEHLDRARRLFSVLNDKGSVAQVDETRARALLAEARNAEAEKIARVSVRALEKGGHQSLLTEALTTHGAALARLGNFTQARLMLFRAMEVGHIAGALNRAGEAALTLIEELGEQLTADEMRTAYECADSWLATTQDKTTLFRLLQAANNVLAVRHAGKVQTVDPFRSENQLTERVRSYERQLIRQALSEARGSITQASRLLGVTHQRLSYILRHRHKELMKERTPIVKRKRRIFKGK